MDAQHQLEIGGVHVGESAIAQDTRIVDEDMNPAPVPQRPFHHGLHLREVGNVATIGHGLAPGGADLVRHRQRGVGLATAVARRPQIVDDDFGAPARQLQCIGTAQAVASPGDDRDLPGEGYGHAKLLLAAMRPCLRRRHSTTCPRALAES